MAGETPAVGPDHKTDEILHDKESPSDAVDNFDQMNVSKSDKIEGNDGLESIGQFQPATEKSGENKLEKMDISKTMEIVKSEQIKEASSSVASVVVDLKSSTVAVKEKSPETTTVIGSPLKDDIKPNEPMKGTELEGEHENLVKVDAMELAGVNGGLKEKTDTPIVKKDAIPVVPSESNAVIQPKQASDATVLGSSAADETKLDKLSKGANLEEKPEKSFVSGVTEAADSIEREIKEEKAPLNEGLISEGPSEKKLVIDPKQTSDTAVLGSIQVDETKEPANVEVAKAGNCLMESNINLVPGDMKKQEVKNGAMEVQLPSSAVKDTSSESVAETDENTKKDGAMAEVVKEVPSSTLELRSSLFVAEAAKSSTAFGEVENLIEEKEIVEGVATASVKIPEDRDAEGADSSRPIEISKDTDLAVKTVKLIEAATDRDGAKSDEAPKSDYLYANAPPMSGGAKNKAREKASNYGLLLKLKKSIMKVKAMVTLKSLNSKTLH